MARLRFPGRPGYRFDRLGVRYGVDEPRRGLDPTTRLIANLHRGLRYFRELFGESDEEDFEGFSVREVRKAEKKWANLLDPLTKVITPRPSVSTSSSAKRVLRSRETPEVTPVSSRCERQTSSPSDKSTPVAKATNSKEQLLAVQKVRAVAKEKVTLREMHKKLLKKGLVKPMKTTIGSKVRELEIKRREKEKLKLKREKEKRLALKQKEKKKRQEEKEAIEKEKKEKAAADSEQKPLKLKPIKIRLGSDGNEAKIVRGPGRPSIYDKDSPTSKVSAEPEDQSPRGRSAKKVRFKDEVVLPARRGRRKKVVVVPGSKRVDKTVAKQLLAKAKRGQPKKRQPKGLQMAEGEEGEGGEDDEMEEKRQVDRALGSPSKPRQFVLPAVSSRSSRKIIPNKRFIEETFPSYPMKKTKFGSPPSASLLSPADVKPFSPQSHGQGSSAFSDETMETHFEEVRTPPSSGLPSPESALGSPLIVEGKRERKPSMKLIMKLTDEDVMSRKLENRKKIEEKKKHHGETTSPLKPTVSNIEQLKAAGFTQSEIKRQIEAEQLELSQLEELERTAEATKRSGQNILRKAKLQLNRAALNRSKAALARSLKREMKREEKKQASLKASEQLSVKTVGFGGFRSQPMSNLQLSPLKLTTFGQQGIGGIPQVPKFSLETSLPTSPLLGAGLAAASEGNPPGETFRFPKDSAVAETSRAGPSGGSVSSGKSPSEGKSRGKPSHGHQPGVCAVCRHTLVERYTKVTVTYYGVPCCPPCQWFYRRRVWQQFREGTVYVCAKESNCDISIGTRSCIACRFQRCQDVLPNQKDLLFTKKNFNKESQQEKKVGLPKIQKLVKQKKEKEAKKCQSKASVSGGKKDGKKEKKKQVKERKRSESETPTKVPKKEGKERRSSEGRRKSGEVILAETDSTKGDQGTQGIPSSSATESQELKIEWPPSLADNDQLGDEADEDDSEWASFLNTSQESDADGTPSDAPPGANKAVFAKPFSFGPSDILDWSAGGAEAQVGDASTLSGSESDFCDEVSLGSSGAVVRGPRIKHVCRKASVALGRPATFPERPELRLSALSKDEKKKVLKKEQTKRPGTPDSDDLSIEEIIRRARDDENVVHIKDSRAEARKLKALVHSGSSKGRLGGQGWMHTTTSSPTSSMVPVTKVSKIRIRKRKMRCRKCEGCKSSECGKCTACKDMVKFGGRGVAKKACMKRLCTNPVMPTGYISKKERRKRQEGPGGGGAARKRFPDVPREKTESSPSRPTLKMSMLLPSLTRPLKKEWESNRNSGDQRRSPVAAQRTTLSEKKVSGMATGGHHRVLTKLNMKNKVRFRQKEKGGRGDTVVLQSITRASERWAAGRDKYTIMADFKEDFDIDEAWRRGVPIISSAPTCVRTVCFLCASAGKHEMVYCNVCCEPFHQFCLEDKERPRVENIENWCCRRCQFCHVCGKQNNLLCCDKCQNTYHPECLGPNYPTKPSRHKNIWVCTKCVKCKSCGVTSPGTHPTASWTHDFSLCYDCGQLMDKGNYCPLCKKCYADDDWDCKMIQCSSCESWVHAKCEGLTDEMYQVLSYLPEDIAYNCRVCLPVHPAPWEQTIRREIHAGIAAVIRALSTCKSTQHLDKVKLKEPEPDPLPLVTESARLRRTRRKGADGDAEAVAEDMTKDESIELCEAHDLLIAMEELDPDVLATAESLLQQVCEAEEAFSRENTSSQAFPGGESTNQNVILGGPTWAGCTSAHEQSPDLGSSSVVATANKGAMVTCVAKGTSVWDALEDRLESNQCYVPKAEFIQSQTLHTQDAGGSHALPATGTKTVMASEEDAAVAMQPSESHVCDKAPITATELSLLTVPQVTRKDIVAMDTDILDSHDNCKIGMALLGDDIYVENTKLGVTCLQTRVSKPSGSNVKNQGALSPNCTSEAGPSASNTEHQVAVSSLESDQKVADKDVPCEGTSRKELAKEDEDCDLPVCDGTTAGIDQLGCQSESVGDSEVNPAHQNEAEQSSATCLAEVLDSFRLKAVSSVQTLSLTDVAENHALMRHSPGHNSPSVQQSAPTDPRIGQKVGTDKSNDLHKVSTVPDHQRESLDGAVADECNTGKCPRPKVTFDLGFSNSCHDNDQTQEDQEVEQALDGAALPSDGGLLSNDRSPSATLTADEVAMDTLSDFEEELMGSRSTLQHVAVSSFLQFRRESQRHNFPKNIKEVQQKVKDKKYRTVEEFNDDVVRIIQFNITQLSEEGGPQYRHKATNSVRSLFMKTMKNCFPWFTVTRSQRWDHNKRLPDGMLDDATVPPSEDHIYAQWLVKDDGPQSPQPSPFKKLPLSPLKHPRIPMASLETDDEVDFGKANGQDTRRCVLCGTVGDQQADDAGRLLSTGQDDWAHTNCALWSAEVFEEVDGTLQNVLAAIARGRQMKCDHCGSAGATVGCCCRGCPANFHFMCARRQRCIFQEDKKVYCRLHWDMMDGELVEHNKFAVVRRLCVEMTNNKWSKKSWQKGLNPNTVNILIGSLTVESLGRLMPLSDCKSALYPVDFTCSRIYWSTVDARRRCVYTCRIVLVKPECSATTDVVVKDMTVIHDLAHPNYDPAKVEALKEMMKPPISRRRRKSVISGSSDSSDSSDEDYILPRSYQEKENTGAMRPRGIKESSNSSKSCGLPRATCGSGKQVAEANKSWSAKTSEPRPKFMTPVPSLTGEGASPTPVPMVTKCGPRPVLSASVLNSGPECRKQPRLSESALKRLGAVDPPGGPSDDDDLSLTSAFVKSLNEAAAKNKLHSRPSNSAAVQQKRDHGLTQTAGSTVAPVDPVTIAPSNQEQSYFLQTVDTSERASMRRGSQDSLIEEPVGMPQPVAAETIALREVISESHASTLRDKLDVVIQHVGKSSQASGLHSRLLQLHSHISVNETDVKTSDRVCALLEQVPDLLQGPSQVDDSAHLEGLSAEIEDLLEKANSSLNSSTPEDEDAFLKDIMIQGASEVLDGEGNLVLDPETANTLLTSAGVDQQELTEAGQIMLCLKGGDTRSSKLEPDLTNTTGHLEGIAAPQTIGGEGDPKDDLGGDLEDDLGGDLEEARGSLSPEELKEAEAAMLKAQVDGKDDEDDKPLINNPSEGLKQYPLRHTAARAAAPQPAATEESLDITPATVVLHKLPSRALRRLSQDGDINLRGEDLPLADQIALKIKAESLARSAPSADGPFKCPTCKRVYRTLESYSKHVANCDYWVSSEDDDDEEDAPLDQNLVEEKSPEKIDSVRSYPLRNSRLRTQVEVSNVKQSLSKRLVRGLSSCPAQVDCVPETKSANQGFVSNNQQTPVRRGRGRPPRPKQVVHKVLHTEEENNVSDKNAKVIDESKVIDVTEDASRRRSLRNSIPARDSSDPVPEVTTRQSLRHESGDSDRSLKSEMSPGNDKAIITRRSSRQRQLEGADGPETDLQNQPNHEGHLSVEDKVEVDSTNVKAVTNSNEKFLAEKHRMCPRNDVNVECIHEVVKGTTAESSGVLLANHKDIAKEDDKPHEDAISLKLPNSEEKFPQSVTTESQDMDVAKILVMKAQADKRGSSPLGSDVVVRGDSNETTDVTMIKDNSRAKEVMDTTDSLRTDKNEVPQLEPTPDAPAVVMVTTEQLQTTGSNCQPCSGEVKERGTADAMDTSFGNGTSPQSTVISVPSTGDAVHVKIRSNEQYDTQGQSTNQVSDTIKSTTPTPTVSIASTMPVATKPIVMTTSPSLGASSRMKIVSISPGSLLAGMTKEQQKVALPKLLEALQEAESRDRSTGHPIQAVKRVRIISKSAFRPLPGETSSSKPLSSICNVTTPTPQPPLGSVRLPSPVSMTPTQNITFQHRPSVAVSRCPSVSMVTTGRSNILSYSPAGNRQGCPGMVLPTQNPPVVINPTLTSTNPALTSVAMETPNTMTMSGSIPNIMNLDRRQVVTVVSNGVMPPPQASSLCVPSSTIYRQPTLMQSGLVPSTAYLQPALPPPQTMQVQMLNMLQAQQTMLQGSIVMPPSICVTVHQPVHLTNSGTVFNQRVIATPTLTSMATLHPSTTSVLTNSVPTQLPPVSGVSILPKLATNFSSILRQNTQEEVPSSHPATSIGNWSLPATRLSTSDCLILEELTGQKMARLEGNGIDMAANMLLQNLTEKPIKQPIPRSPPPAPPAALVSLISPCKKQLTQPTISSAMPKTTPASELAERSSSEVAHVKIQAPQGVPTSLYQWEHQNSTHKSGHQQGRKVKFKKVIRKKIVIRRPNLLEKKRKQKDASTKGPASKRSCYYVTDRNGVIHGMLNDLQQSPPQGQGQPLVKRLPQEVSTSPKEGRSLLVGQQGSPLNKLKVVTPKVVTPHSLKVSPSKIKVIQKALRNNYAKENRAVDEMADISRRKHPRKEPLKDRVRVDEDFHVSHSHPLIHPHNQHPVLPQPEVEEEVIAMPTLATYEHEEKKRKERQHGRKDSPYLVFEISSSDGFYTQSDSWHDAWKAVTEKVQDARSHARLKQLSHNGLSGLAMFGLDHDAIVYLIEQLYGANNCTNYRFRYLDYNDMQEEPTIENPSGCARGEAFHTRNPRDMFSFLLSRYRPLPKQDLKKKDEDLALKSQRRATSMELPMAMRFRHLREHAKEAVGVYRSPIHGRGLFCKRDIDAGEMVIEYAGEVIRSIVTDKRENYYESKGIGCYMFRIDDYDVVDATMHGNAARFINHCCDPNCYSRVINVDNKKHIVIFALRPIKKGEELTYDYKFPIEEVKIPCTCDAKRCRRYLN